MSVPFVPRAPPSATFIPMLPMPLLSPAAASAVASAPAAAPTLSPPPSAGAVSVVKLFESATAAADAAVACRPSLTYPGLDVYADGTIRQRWSGNALVRIKRAGRWYVHSHDLAENADGSMAAAAAAAGAPTKQLDRIICEAWHGPHSVIAHSYLGNVEYLDGDRSNLTPANMRWCSIESMAAKRKGTKRARAPKVATSAASAAAAAAAAAAAVAVSAPTLNSMQLPPPTRALSDIASFYDDWNIPSTQGHAEIKEGGPAEDEEEDEEEEGEEAAVAAGDEAPEHADEANKRTKHTLSTGTDTDDDNENAPLRTLAPLSLPPPRVAATPVLSPVGPQPRPQSQPATTVAAAAAAAAVSTHPRIFRYANPDASDAVFQMDAMRPKMIVGAFHTLHDAVRAMAMRLKRDTVEVGNAMLLVLNQPLCQLGGYSWVTPSRLVELHCPPRAVAVPALVSIHHHHSHPASASASASASAASASAMH